MTTNFSFISILSNYSNYGKYPGYSYYNPTSSSSFTQFSGFYIVFFIFVILIIIEILIKAFSDSKTNESPSERVNTPRVHKYISEIAENDSIKIAHPEKYTKLPSSDKIKRIVNPNEIIIPQVLSNEDKTKLKRKNFFIGISLVCIWIIFSFYNGLFSSICSYFLGLWIYSKIFTPVIESVENCTETKLIPQSYSDTNPGQYVPIDINDLLYGWLYTQNKSFLGLFKKKPSPSELRYSNFVRSIFVEIEADVEYFTIMHYECDLPWSNASSQNYYHDPFPVRYPTEFIESSQTFPCDGTLTQESCGPCSGSGKLTCSSCSGSGEVTCSWCGGRGYRESSETVYETDSDGNSISHTETVRDSCSCSNGYVTCKTCSGSGEVTCSKCNGEGKIGIFLIRKYAFHHITKLTVFKETDNHADFSTSLEDLPNEDARLIDLEQLPRLVLSITEQCPNISQTTVDALSARKKEYEQQIASIQNVIFDQFAFREFPELKVTFTHMGKEFQLLGRGYKPLQKKYMQMDKLPFSISQILKVLFPLFIGMSLFLFI